MTDYVTARQEFIIFNTQQRMTTTYPLRTVVFRYSLICCQCFVFDTCLSLYLLRVGPL
jgi:hypothetical protein